MSLITATATFTPGASPREAIDVAVLVRLFASVRRAQRVVVDHAQAIVAVKTGELRSTIQALEPNDNGREIVGEVVATAPYAGYVEFGTGARGAASPGAGPFNYTLSWPGMPAQPYMRPALDSGRAEALAEFQS
jgi:HK97 gp10 family phage protein